VIGPTQDVAAAAIFEQLLDIAERAFDDRSRAEQLVSSVIRQQGQLVAAAASAATAAQREAANGELVRIVRRACLDAMPPVISGVGGKRPTAAAPPAQKLRPISKSAGAAGTGALQPPTAAPRASSANALGRQIAMALGALVLVVAGAIVLTESLQQPVDDSTAPMVSAADPAGSGVAHDPSPATAARPDQPTDNAVAAAEPATTTAVPDPSPAGQTLDEITLLRLEMTEPKDPIGARPPSVTATESGEPTSQPILPVADAADLRIFILYPGEPVAEERAGDLYSTLADSGAFPLVVLRDVDFAISTPRIRYYYDEDAGRAGALADALQAPDAADDDWQLQDFTQFRPLPVPGTLEIFIPSS
jgi:hypothetical protein